MTHHTPEGLPPLPKPDSFLFQHEDTGNTQFVDGQQVEWGFEEHNPHLQKIGGAYTESQMQAYAREALQASRQPPAQRAMAEGAGDVSKAVALCEAVSAIYFDDSSDFKPALLSAIRALSPEMEEMLRDDPRSAWQKADEAKDAALATKEPK